MMIMKGCGGDLRVAAGRDLAPDPWGAADYGQNTTKNMSKWPKTSCPAKYKQQKWSKIQQKVPPKRPQMAEKGRNRP